LIAIAIKVESNGPVLFRQRRRGRYQATIDVLKFRTMRVMEDGHDLRQAVPGDDRVTKVGRFLRRASLDELPQILNVLKGEMSLVGPRPHALAHDEKFSGEINIYADRHQMRPGMTGLAQVTGHRGPTAVAGKMEARVATDMIYIRNWSVWLDIKILLHTFRAVVSGQNAD
jgi:putative colanic acid biosysnthesis UDP-glucose lipid carrier transferase